MHLPRYVASRLPRSWIRLPSTGLALACMFGFLSLGGPSAASETLHVRPRAGHTATSALVELDTARLARRPSFVRLEFPDGTSAIAHLRDFRRRATGVSWFGRIEGSPLRQNVVVTEHRGLFAGRIDLLDRSYVLQPSAPGQARLNRVVPGGLGCGVRDAESVVDSSRPPSEGAPPSAAGSRLDELVGGVAGDPVITVLGLYTPAALDASGGLAQIETLIQAGIDLTNLVFTNSEIAARVELAQTAPLDLDRLGPLPDLETAVAALQNDEQIAALRDATSADLVAAIFEGGAGLCGFANAMDEVGPEFAAAAFSISVRSCVLPRLALTHEIGHNLGARHNPEDSEATPATASFPWSFGHVTPDFHTVMAFESRCAPCLSAPLFSHPGATVVIGEKPIPAGVAGERDNHRTLNATAKVAAAFRHPPPAACMDDGSRLCLSGGRFEVRVDWRDATGNTGVGRRAVSAPDSGLFWFFHPDNWELMVKVIDACDVTNSFWVFAAASTDVEYVLRVTDTESGETRVYTNPLGRTAPAITDTSAFRTCETR